MTTAEQTTRVMTGGALLAEMLKRHEVGPIFGMGGFQLLPFYEACRQLGLRHTLINDERCGIFAADAYARVTNRVGVVDATLGPGATNLVTGMAESFNAGIPIVAIVADANRDHAWKNLTQEARQLDVLRPVAKEVIRVENVRRIPEHVRRAFAVATSGRPGPVVIAVPEDISHGECEITDAELFVDAETISFPSRRTRPSAEGVEKAAALISAAARPILLVGGGIHISQASQQLIDLARGEGIPVAHTMSGKGAIACTDPLSAGVFGRYDRIANDLLAKSDCIIVVGCKLGEVATKRFTIIPHATPLIHIDVVAEEIGRTTKADVALAADARLALQDLSAALATGMQERRQSREVYLNEVVTKLAAWNETARERTTSTERPVNIGRILGELNKALPADAVLVADGGFAAHWGALLFDTKQAGRTFVADRGFASIGYGLPGAMGAKLGVGEGRQVVSLTGDGGFNMTLGELETARRLGVSFVLCVFNNAASGYVKALQHSLYGEGNYQSSDLIEMDYAKVANAMGCLGIRVEDPEELAAAFQKGFEHKDGPVVLDIVVTRDPARMLPAVDNRTLKVKKGDRPV